jgi:RNA polymerase sigma factor (sigma-70 family)
MPHGRLHSVVTYIRHMSRPHQIAASDRELLERFAAQGDEAAFAALVERHAGMVLSTCQRILRNHHDAEDAVQATFFVLARKSGRIRWRESIASWLSAVAYRVAHKARGLVGHCQESAFYGMVQSVPPVDTEALSNELRAVVDDEIQRLPKRLRDPVVLCYLEARTYEQAAQILGWRPSTLKGRLEKARNLLRSRLAGRDLLPGVCLPAVLEAQLGPGAVPARLAASISRIAVLVRAGEAVAPGLMPPQVAALMNCSVPGMTVTKACLLVALVLVMGLSAVGGTLLGRQGGIKDPEERNEQGRLLAPAPKNLSQPAVVAQARLDRFGDPLPEDAIGRLGTTRLRHGGRIRFLRFTPDGKTLVSQAEDGIRTWIVASAALSRFFPKEPATPAGASVDLSPDGKLLAAPGASGVGIWEIDTGRRVRTLGTASSTLVCFSTDGATLATVNGANADEISLWQVSSGRLLRSWKDTQGPITSLLFTGDGQAVLTANTAWRPPMGRESNRITAWDPATGKEWRRIELGSYGPNQIAVSSNGRLLAALCRTNMSARVLVWELATGQEVWRLEPGPPPPNQPGRPGELNSLTFFPDGKLLIAGQGDDLLVTWSAATGPEKRLFSRELALAGVLAVSRDGKTVAASPPQSAIRLIDWDTGKYKFSDMTYPYRSVAGVTAHGRTVVMRGGHDVYVWDPTTGHERLLFERPETTFWRVRLTTDERRLQVWEEMPRQEAVRAVSVWDLATGNEVERVQCPEKSNESLYPLALSPDGKTAALLDLASNPRADAVVLMEMNTGKILRRLAGNGPMALRATFTQDGRRLVVWRPGEMSSLHVWDSASGQLLMQIPIQGPKPDVPGIPRCEPQISPDGRRVAVAGQGLSFAVYDLTTGELVRSVDKLDDNPQILALSQDGRCIAWGGKRSPIVAIVELASGRERQRLAGHEGKIMSLEFSGNGKMLVSHSDDTTALAWDLTGRLAAGSAWGKPLAAAELDSCWEDLANENAARACRATHRLVSVPSQAVAFLGQRIAPVRAADAGRVALVIANLDSKEFTVREAAAAELVKLGETAISACQQALGAKPTLEVERRLKAILEKHRDEWKNPSKDRLRVIRAVETLEQIGMPEARPLLEALAGGTLGSRLTQEAKAALARLNARGTQTGSD